MLKTFLIVILALVIIIPAAFFAYKFLISKNTSIPQTIQNLSKKSGLTLAETYVLSNILKTKTEQELNEFHIAVRSAAVYAEALDITNCSPTPVVLNLGEKKSITVKNNDELIHTLVLYDNKYQIPAKGSLDVPIKIKEGAVYPYSCDGNISVAGVIWIPR